MGADHRKPVAAFVVLAFVAAGLLGMQRADAHGGGFLASAAGVAERIEKALRHPGPPTSAGDDPLSGRTGRFVALSQPPEAAHDRSRSGDAQGRGLAGGHRGGVERRGAPAPTGAASAHPTHPAVKARAPGLPKRDPHSSVRGALARGERRARQSLVEGARGLRRTARQQKAVQQADKASGRAARVAPGFGLSD